LPPTGDHGLAACREDRLAVGAGAHPWELLPAAGDQGYDACREDRLARVPPAAVGWLGLRPGLRLVCRRRCRGRPSSCWGCRGAALGLRRVQGRPSACWGCRGAALVLPKVLRLRATWQVAAVAPAPG